MLERLRVRRAACATALAVRLAWPAAGAAGPAIEDPSCGEFVLATRPDAPVIALPHGFLRAGTDSVWSARGPWRRGVDYSLERVKGELRLLREAVPGESLHVRACWLLDPPPFELQLEHYRPATAPESAARALPETAPRPATAHAAAPPSGASLSLTGNKTLAVEFGSSQDAVLRQSLDLALSGTVAPGVQLTGVLTDRNTPVTAAGSTLELQAVDQVRLELTAPQGSAMLGDLSVKFDDGEFARLDRRLQGVRGEWSAGGARLVASLASAAGEYNRLQFFGADGQQGPYLLTDRDGGTGISVVAGSEIVTLDGERMTRGEAADYSIDYERARVTFTSRHLITAASRITVDYQFALRRFKRNFTAVSGRWDRGTFHAYTRILNESDDRGSPLGTALSAEDRLALAAAGDSASRAIGPGVTAGGGDYDTVRVAAGLVYAFAGPDSGQYSVQFAPVGAGRGDYADSAIVAGRTTYHYVGANLGSFVVGHALPFAESHTLWAAGAGGRVGALALEAEGALSHQDLNTFSTLDDGANAGYAARAKARLEGALGLLPGRAALEIEGRSVDRRFAPFTRLAIPFEAEHWGLPTDADFEHAKRVGAAGEWLPRAGGQLRADGGHARTPDGYSSDRWALLWSGAGRLLTHAQWERSNAEHDAWAFTGGRDRVTADARWSARWLAPLVRFERDERRFPSDTGRVGDRFIAGGAELASGSAMVWHGLAGFDLRRDARDEAGGFVDQSESRTWRLALDSPAGGNLGASLLAQRRDVLPLANPQRTRSDLASARIRAERPKQGLKGELDVEIGSEGENRRDRSVVFVGTGKGTYDAFGNFVGTGDYNLVVTVSPTLDRLARAATHARASWLFGANEAWRGSRVEFTYESGAWRAGNLHLTDPIVAPGAMLADAGLVRGSVLQRLESELAPQSRAAATLIRLERRVTADRSYEQFGQTTEQREMSARWRARPGPRVSTEIELTARRQSADQQLVGNAAYHRVLEGEEASVQAIFTPDARLRAVAAGDVSWTRPEGQPLATQVIQIGPDLGITLGSRGRGQVGARRAFSSGPPAVALLPTADPAGAPRWQGNARFDYRLLESFTLGLSANLRKFDERKGLYTGRAEMRAFF